MKKLGKRLGAVLAVLLMMVSVVRFEGAAVLEGVYFTAVNQQLLELNDETMPFWLDGMMYVPERIFEGGELGVRYVHSYSKGLVMLYTAKKDLRFDLTTGQVYDKNGMTYKGSAVEKNGHVFLPLDLICRCFGLSWSLSDTAYAPLVRIKSEDAVLSDWVFIDAASLMMANRYAEYEKQVNSSREENGADGNTGGETVGPDEPDQSGTDHSGNTGGEQTQNPPPVQAQDGQKIHLIFAGYTEDSMRDTADLLGMETATFLLTVQQMEDGDLIRSLLGRGHSIALMVQSTSADEIGSELLRAKELVWAASCSLLQFVWYEGVEDIAGLLQEQGCVRVAAQLDRRGEPLRSSKDAAALMQQVGRIHEDITLYLGYGSDSTELVAFLDALLEAEYRLCAWRMTIQR